MWLNRNRFRLTKTCHLVNHHPGSGRCSWRSEFGTNSSWSAKPKCQGPCHLCLRLFVWFPQNVASNEVEVGVFLVVHFLDCWWEEKEMLMSRRTVGGSVSWLHVQGLDCPPHYESKGWIKRRMWGSGFTSLISERKYSHSDDSSLRTTGSSLFKDRCQQWRFLD